MCQKSIIYISKVHYSFIKFDIICLLGQTIKTRGSGELLLQELNLYGTR